MQMGQETEKKLWKILAFHVHSDTNPAKVKVAGERLAAVMDNKGNDDVLMRYAREWGIPLSNFKIPMPRGWNVLYTGSFIDVLWRQNETKVAFSGYIVDFVKNNITDNIKVYICTPDGKIRVIYVAQQNVNILVGKTDNLQAYGAAKEAYADYQKREKEAKKKEDAKAKRDKYKEFFKKFGLKPNTNYKYYGLRMDYNGIWYDVVRTTTNKVILAYMGIEIKISIENASKVYS